MLSAEKSAKVQQERQQQEENDFDLGLPLGYCRRLKFTQDNAPVIVDYLKALGNEIHLSDNYKRINLTTLVYLSRFHSNKKFKEMTIDEIIAKSDGSNIQTIKYIVKFDPEDSPDGQMRAGSRRQFSYDQFVNWTFDDLYKLHTKPWKDLPENIGPTTRMYK